MSGAETLDQKQARWDKEWKNALYGAELGNPLATLCQHCYGRHKPPRDKECPNQPPGQRDSGAENDRKAKL